MEGEAACWHNENAWQSTKRDGEMARVGLPRICVPCLSISPRGLLFMKFEYYSHNTFTGLTLHKVYNASHHRRNLDVWKCVTHLLPSAFFFSSIYKIFVLVLPFTLGWEESHLSNGHDPTWPWHYFWVNLIFSEIFQLCLQHNFVPKPP